MYKMTTTRFSVVSSNSKRRRQIDWPHHSPKPLQQHQQREWRCPISLKFLNQNCLLLYCIHFQLFLSVDHRIVVHRHRHRHRLISWFIVNMGCCASKSAELKANQMSRWRSTGIVALRDAKLKASCVRLFYFFILLYQLLLICFL